LEFPQQRQERHINKRMINFEQQELIDELFQLVKARFPEVELLNVTAPTDEDREIAMTELASEKTTDLLLDYGYSISIMPRHRQVLQVA